MCCQVVKLCSKTDVCSILCVGLCKKSMKLMNQVGWIYLQIVFRYMVSTDGLYSYVLLNISYFVTFIPVNIFFILSGVFFVN